MLPSLLIFQDEFSKNVQEWNSLRVESVELALTRLLFPELRKELQTHLLSEAREAILKTCCRKLYNWLKVCSEFQSVKLGIFSVVDISPDESFGDNTFI